ncbi:MAG: MFS transporter [Candidatus Thermoplasmatota archaeon]|nr:MFS transporter [Candidatus Thermoplasmatota archaeon]
MAIVDRRIKLALLGAFCYNLTQGLSFTLIRLQANFLGDFRTLGLVVGLPNFALVAGSAFWGYVADRWRSRKSVVVLCSIVTALLYLPLPWLGPLELVLVRTIQSFFLGGMVQIATMFSELDSSARGSFMGRLEAVLGLGWGVGAFAGGYLVNENSYGLGSGPVIFSFFFTAFLGFISVIGYMSSTEKKREVIAVKEDFLVYFRRLSRLFAITFILFMGYIFFLTISPVYLTNIAGSSNKMGLIVLCSGLIHALTAPYAGNLIDKYPRETAIRLASAFVIISMLAYSFTENLYVITLVFTIPIYMTFFLGARTIVADTVPYDLRARTMGLLSSFSLLGSGFGSLIVGELLLHYEEQQVFLFGAFLASIAFILSLKNFSHQRN